MEDLSSLSYRQLQKRCKELGLSCKGKREILENRILEAEEEESILEFKEEKRASLMNEYEQVIYDQNPEMYFMLKKLIPLIPEDRPEGVLEDMKNEGLFLVEEQNKWRILVEELSAIFIHPEDADFMRRLQEENIEEYMKENSPIPAIFFDRYPAMAFIFSQTIPRGTIVPLLLFLGRMDLLDLRRIRLNYRDLRYVRNEEFLKKLIDEYPNIANRLKIDYAIQYPGTTLLLLLTDPYYLTEKIYLSDADLAKANPESASMILQDRKPTKSLLMQAIAQNRIELVKIILEDGRVDPIFNWSRPLRIAVYNGQEEIVEMLLKDNRSDPSSLKNEAIRHASEKGYANIVRMLLQDPLVDSTINNNEPLRLAQENGHQDVVDILLEDKRMNI